jgi:hypothetical protein
MSTEPRDPERSGKVSGGAGDTINPTEMLQTSSQVEQANPSGEPPATSGGASESVSKRMKLVAEDEKEERREQVYEKGREGDGGDDEDEGEDDYDSGEKGDGEEGDEEMEGNEERKERGRKGL